MANLAFISTAHIHTKGFIDNILKAGDGRRVIAVWDDEPGRGQRYAQMAGAPFESDIRKVMDNPAVDGFVICAENTRHRPLLEKLLPVGKPVFCEKPLVTTAEDLAAVRKLHQSHPVPLFCGYFMPFQPALQAVNRALAENKAGKPTHVRFRNAHHAAYGKWFDSPDLRWFTDPALSGGGALMDMGTHAVHVLRSLFGPVTRVWAHTANLSGIYPSVDDFGIIQMQFASGIHGTAEAAWIHNGGPCGLEVMASDYSILPEAGTYALCKPGSNPSPLPEAPARPNRIDRLVAVIRGQVPQDELDRDLAAIFDCAGIMAAAYRSAGSGKWENPGT